MAIVGVGVALTLAQAFRQARRRRMYGLAMQLAESEVAARRDHAREREDSYRRQRRDLDATLQAIGAGDVRAAEALLATTEEQAERAGADRRRAAWSGHRGGQHPALGGGS